MTPSDTTGHMATGRDSASGAQRGQVYDYLVPTPAEYAERSRPLTTAELEYVRRLLRPARRGTERGNSASAGGGNALALADLKHAVE